MPSLLAPIVVVAGSIGMLALAHWKMPVAHMALAAIIAAILSAMSLTEAKRLAASGSSPGRIAGCHTFHAASLLLWAALSVLATYTLVLAWDEWWQFFTGFAVLGGLVLLLARTLVSDAAKGPDDAAMLIIARFLAWLLLLGGSGAAIGLVADKKMTRFMSPRYTDWAANNAFFFGGIALAALGWAILSASRKPRA